MGGINSLGMTVAAIDLYCGGGGLTRGLLDAGLDVRLGVDIDPACRTPFEVNNDVPFEECDVLRFPARKLKHLLRNGDASMIAGCAPCQPFSSYNTFRGRSRTNRLLFVRRLVDIIQDVKPLLFTMENVPALSLSPGFELLLKRLRLHGYYVWSGVVDARNYGVPQTRRRLIVLGSRLGPIRIVDATHIVPSSWRTVRQTIDHLAPLKAGEADQRDPLHVCSRMSNLNLRRIRASQPGGSWRDWPASLRANCHQGKRGQRYVSVYGRMTWDAPAPTITTQCFGFGNGRFGHPEQDRAISLREAAMLQTFPEDYQFVSDDQPVRIGSIGRLIGNAVPVKLAEIVGKSVHQHLKEA